VLAVSLVGVPGGHVQLREAVSMSSRKSSAASTHTEVFLAVLQLIEAEL